MADIPTRYDAKTDEIVPVTQDWVDLAMQRMTEMHNALEKSRAAQDHGSDSPRLEAPEGQQGGQNSKGSGQGVQQGGRGEGQTQEVACAYAVTVDGFIAISPKAIRNPESSLIVWMSHARWQKLAVCATTQGQFYIPCTPTLNDVSVLRALAEAPDAV
jgi:hypothetical protein